MASTSCAACSAPHQYLSRTSPMTLACSQSDRLFSNSVCCCTGCSCLLVINDRLSAQPLVAFKLHGAADEVCCWQLQNLDPCPLKHQQDHRWLVTARKSPGCPAVKDYRPVLLANRQPRHNQCSSNQAIRCHLNTTNPQHSLLMLSKLHVTEHPKPVLCLHFLYVSNTRCPSSALISFISSCLVICCSYADRLLCLLCSNHARVKL